jgi:hypothetical protein
MLFRNDNRDAVSNESVALLPLRELIVFPYEVYAILVGRQKSIKALEAAEQHKRPILEASCGLVVAGMILCLSHAARNRCRGGRIDFPSVIISVTSGLVCAY